MKNPSTSRKAKSYPLPLATCLTFSAAGLIWALSGFNTVRAQDTVITPAVSEQSTNMQSRHSGNSTVRQQRIKASETPKARPGGGSPRGSPINQEVNQDEKAGPEPFTDREQSIQQKVRRALV